MTNDDFIARIKRMSALELLDLVVYEPNLLTDSYYKDFGKAILTRYVELTDKEKPQ